MRQKSIIFWKNTPYSRLLSLMIFISLLSLVVMLLSRHFGYELVYGWETMGKLQNKDILLDTVEKGFFRIEIDASIYYTNYNYEATLLQIPVWASKTWLIGFAIVASLLGAASTSFRRIYFLAAATLLILFVMSLRTDLIGIGGIYSLWLSNSIFLVLIVGVNYYLHSFRKNLSFLQKWLINLLLWAALLACVFLAAQEKYPSVFLANFGIAIPAILCVATIFLVSTELPFLFASLSATHTLTGKLNFRNFHFIMIFYVGNLLLLYLKNSRILTFDIIYFDPFYILAIALVMGIWGTRHNPLFQVIIPEKLRTWVYVALIVNVGLVVAYFHSTANEAAVLALQNFISYSFLTFAVAYWIYVAVNFNKHNNHLSQKPFTELFYGFQAEKIIPLYLARGLGFFLLGMILYKEKAFLLKQSIASYYGGLGDVYLLHHNTTNAYIANDYYDQALTYDPLNHKFWYAKAHLVSLKDQASVEEIASKIDMLEFASQKAPQAQDYALIAKEFLAKDQPLLATLEYKEAIAKFPKNPYLNSNLSIILAKEGVMDSALYFQKISKEYLPNKQESDANFLAILLQKPVIPADSIEQYLSTNNDRFYEINRLAMLTTYQKKNKKPFELSFSRKSLNDTSQLTSLQAAYLYNYLVASASQDTTALYLSQKLLNTQANLSFSELLNLARKVHFFNNYQHQKGIETARYLNFISSSDYQFLYAKYLLYLGESQKAARELLKLRSNAFTSVPYAEILYHLAIAQSESHNVEEAKNLWVKIANDASNKSRMSLARKMLEIYEYPAEKWQEASDTVRFGLVYYRQDKLDRQVEIAKSIQTPDLKIKAVAFVIENLLANKQIDTAQALFDALPEQIENSLEAQKKLNLAYLKLLFFQHKKQEIGNLIETIPLDRASEGYRFFLKAWLIEENKANDAAKKYAKAIESNPFDLFFYPKMIALQNRLGNQQTIAYDYGLQATLFREDDTTAWEMYFMQCLEAKYEDYAQNALLKIQELNPAIYAKCKAIFEEKRR